MTRRLPILTWLGWVLFLLTLLGWLLPGCALSAAQPERDQVPAFACYETFQTALEGWELYVGPVPEKCRTLDLDYELIVTDDMPSCGAGGTMSWVDGCHFAGPGDSGTIYLRAGLGDYGTIATHEWLHALAGCTGGDDSVHEDPRVWGGYSVGGPPIARDSALAHGILNAPVGPCLESEK